MNHITLDISKKPCITVIQHMLWVMSLVIADTDADKYWSWGTSGSWVLKKMTKLYVMHMMPSAMTAEHKNVTFIDADRNKVV